jgi:hypothetical protein
MIDERIKHLALSGGIDSFYDILDKPMTKDGYSYVIPGVLPYYDLPDLRKALGERLESIKK